VALLRVFSGAHDREFALERFREIRELLESAEELGDGVTIVREILDGFRRRPTRPGTATRSRSSGIPALRGLGRNAPEYRSKDPLRRHLRR
jgi:hypothetical protein